MADWIRSQGDQLHSLYARLTDSSGGLNIPLETTVTFAGRMIGDTVASIGGTGVIVRAGAEADDPNRGFVRYDLSTSDVAEPGLFFCKWRLVPPDTSQRQSFPEDAEMILIILPAV